MSLSPSGTRQSDNAPLACLQCDTLPPLELIILNNSIIKLFALFLISICFQEYKSINLWLQVDFSFD